jgi:hypothetical protein
VQVRELIDVEREREQAKVLRDKESTTKPIRVSQVCDGYSTKSGGSVCTVPEALYQYTL